jgi:2-dehydropantoate 2-reductase
MKNNKAMKKTKILVAGIGGVGGWFGGMLAKHFIKSNEIEISFLAKGEHLKQIQQHGLKVIKGNEGFIAKPKLATDNANEIGKVDFILLCTKSYDLEKTILQLQPCIYPETVIIPFLNGVDSVDKIKQLLPENLVAGGCVYIVSSIKENGVVENSGNIQTLYFGLDNSTNEKLNLLEKIFLEAKIEATLSQNISSVQWEKFHLVAANSTATSFYNNTTGEILANQTKANFLFSLLNEVNQVALAKGVLFEKEMIETTLNKLKSMPFETTSSMQRDFWKKNGKTELETITGYVMREGKALNIPTPSFEIAYEKLKN